jgi:hypothetical protein
MPSLQLDHFGYFESIVADPDPPNPRVFCGPPGSGSISQRGMDTDPDLDPSIIKQK